MTKERGQATTESIFVATFLVIVVSTILTMCYLTFSSYWIHHHLYESLICYQSTTNPNICEKLAQKRIEEILPRADHKTIEIYEDGHHLIGRFQFHSLTLEEKIGI